MPNSPILQQLVKRLYCDSLTVVLRCCCMIDLAASSPQMVACFGLVDSDGPFLAFMYSHALGERAESKIAVVDALAKMQARMYRKTPAVMHPPKDEQRPWEYQFRWCRVRPIIKHQYDLVGYSLASLLNSYG